MSLSCFDHPYLGALLGHEEIAACFSPDEDLRAMLMFEKTLAEEQGRLDLIPAETVPMLVTAIDGFEADHKDLSVQTARDGVLVPGLIRQIRKTLDEETRPYLHRGATSQDVIDTSLVLRLKTVLQRIGKDLMGLDKAFAELDETFGDKSLMAHTRLQRALPISARQKIDSWRRPLSRLAEDQQGIEEDLLQIQLGGPVGDLAAFGDEGLLLKQRMAEKLGLGWAEACWHTDRSALIAFCQWLARISTSTGKFGMDVALMAQNEVGEIRLGSSGGSSAMPHKQNPVQAEILVSLARFCAGQLGILQQAALHENERSGISWTMEWMTLPSFVVAAAGSVRIATELAANIEEIRSADG